MMKRSYSCLLAVISMLLFFGCASTPTTISSQNFKTAKGTLIWRLEDTAGNTIKDGVVIDGEWKQAGGLLKDYIVLDKDENNEIKTALVVLGGKRVPLYNFSIQIFHDGFFYPGKSFGSRYSFLPSDWGDTGTRFGKGNKQKMLFNWGSVTCAYRFGNGGFVNQIIINPNASITCEIEDKYVFHLLGGTDYFWSK